jgi:hypothetical protein
MEPEDLGVVLGLLLQIGHFVAGVSDLADPDHTFLLRLGFFAVFLVLAYFLRLAAQHAGDHVDHNRIISLLEVPLVLQTFSWNRF